MNIIRAHKDPYNMDLILLRISVRDCILVPIPNVVVTLSCKVISFSMVCGFAISHVKSLVTIK